MKECPECEQELPEEEFNWRFKDRGIRQRECKKCHNARKRQAYKDNPRKDLDRVRARRDRVAAENKLFIRGYLSEHVCVDCGEDDVEVLQFDHVRGRKRWHVSEMAASGYNLQTIIAEIAKCDVRCANCHIRVTNRRRREQQQHLAVA